MLPLIPIALSLVPELIRLIAGDKAGTVAADVAAVVQTVTGASDGAEAGRRLAADPALATELRVKLAQIALETQKAADEAAGQARAAELDSLRAAIADTQDARHGLQSLAQAHSPMAWGAPAVSVLVAGGFFAILALLLWRNDTGRSFDPAVTSIVNLTIGALAASFATVVNFWLGSSQGSRDKDAIMRDLRIVQAAVPAPVPASQSAPAPTPAPTPAPDRFEACLAIVLDKEGGFTDDPRDAGGATNMGITLATLAEWRGCQPADLAPDDVRGLARREAAEIYRARYWLPMRCGDLPAGIDLMVFDFGVNAGPRMSVKLLQRAAGVLDDGSAGPRTLAAVRQTAAATLLDRLAEARLAYYRGLPSYAAFGAGWTNRTRQVAALAHAMV